MKTKTINGYTLQYVFEQAHLEKLGATFAEFEANPEATLEKYGQRDAVRILETGYRPLLPAQVRERQKLEAQWKAEGTWDQSMAISHLSKQSARRGGAATQQLAA